MTTLIGRILHGSWIAAGLILLAWVAAAQDQMPQTRKERIAGAPNVTKKHVRGTVVYLEGNTLLVRLSSGEMKEFNVPESRKFMIDGREVSVHELKPGTRLTATITTTVTPVTERTTTI